MLEDYIYEYIHNYIENEINYIISKEDCSNFDKLNISDLYMLQNMKEDKKMEIAEKIVNNNKLGEKINEMIHYYLYEKEVE